jgi:pimeloyl-ACP methyl ester carboxylesterase
MKTILPLTILSVLMLIVHSPLFSQSITGTWNGVLDIQGMAKLRLVFHIQEENGVYTATMDSPDQGASGIPTQGVTYEHPTVTIDMSALGAKYVGAVAEDFSAINGTFTQAGLILELKLGREEIEKEVQNRPQEPKPPYPYYEENVTFENKSAGVTLAGTFTRPDKKGKYPVVVLVSGSGPQNRDEELLGHKPFLVLADHLTRQGIAVLRYDDRGVGESTGRFSTATSEDFASDALAAVAFLKTRKDVDKKHIGIAGHSEGGLIAPMCAAKSKDVAFIVLLAGPGVDGGEILLSQTELIERAEGYSEDRIARDVDNMAKTLQMVRTESDTDQLRQELTKLFKETLAALPEEERIEEGSIDTYVKNQVDQMASPWMRFFIQYDPKTSLKKVTCPVLAINGEKDLQVDPKLNLPAIEAALKMAGNTRYEVIELPGLNHLFQESATGSLSEYAQIEQTFSPVALEVVSNWILKTVGK